MQKQIWSHQLKRRYFDFFVFRFKKRWTDSRFSPAGMAQEARGQNVFYLWKIESDTDKIPANQMHSNLQHHNFETTMNCR